MSARTTEIPHNTDAQVRTYITAALDLVDDLDPPGDLRGAVFLKACEFYSAKSIQVEQVVPMMPPILDGRGR